jgi:hypothetical protein
MNTNNLSLPGSRPRRDPTAYASMRLFSLLIVAGAILSVGVASLLEDAGVATWIALAAGLTVLTAAVWLGTVLGVRRSSGASGSSVLRQSRHRLVDAGVRLREWSDGSQLDADTEQAISREAGART